MNWQMQPANSQVTPSCACTQMSDYLLVRRLQSWCVLRVEEGRTRRVLLRRPGLHLHPLHSLLSRQ